MNRLGMVRLGLLGRALAERFLRARYSEAVSLRRRRCIPQPRGAPAHPGKANVASPPTPQGVDKGLCLLCATPPGWAPAGADVSRGALARAWAAECSAFGVKTLLRCRTVAHGHLAPRGRHGVGPTLHEWLDFQIIEVHRAESRQGDGDTQLARRRH